MTFIHTTCGDLVEIERRMIHTLPGDPTWPTDQQLLVPFCRTCQRLVNVDELGVRLS